MKILITAEVDLDALNRQDPEEPFTPQQAADWIADSIKTGASLGFGGRSARAGFIYEAPLADLTISLTVE